MAQNQYIFGNWASAKNDTDNGEKKHQCQCCQPSKGSPYLLLDKSLLNITAKAYGKPVGFDEILPESINDASPRSSFEAVGPSVVGGYIN
jgi:hypothetical protein